MEDRQEILNKKELVDAKLAVAQGANCDKYDYLISVFCGVSCGLIDAFLVGKEGTYHSDICFQAFIDSMH